MTTPVSGSQPSPAGAVFAAHRDEVKRTLDCVSPAALESLLSLLRTRQRSRAIVYVAGNGGSAANASHCAMHLRECGIKALCLNDSPVHLTAIGNDFGYEYVFSRGVPEGELEPAEMVLVFSCSGKSPNILHLLKLAKDQGAAAAGILGFNGGLAAATCDVHLSLDSQSYEALEDAHSAIIHGLKMVLSKPT